MASSLSLILDSVQQAILTITPEDLPDIPWQYTTDTALLEQAMLQAGELARIFAVYPLTNPEDNDRTNWSQAEIRQSVIVEVRYHIPARFGGEMQARRLAGADAARIFHMLVIEWEYPAIDGQSVSGPLIQTRALPSRSMTSQGNDNYVMRLEFRYIYTMDALGVDQSPAP